MPRPDMIVACCDERLLTLLSRLTCFTVVLRSGGRHVSRFPQPKYTLQTKLDGSLIENHAKEWT